MACIALRDSLLLKIYPKRMNFRCRHCEAHHVDLYYDNIYGLKQSRVLRPFLDCFTSAVATVRNDAPFKHHLKMKRFEYSGGDKVFKNASSLTLGLFYKF